LYGGENLSKDIYIFQKGFNFSQDGPGNRLVYHLCGCNLYCPWCSNPEGLTCTKNAVKLTVDDIVKEAVSCKMIFIDGGGVTLTGGEVTCQKESVSELLTNLKKQNIHTCIETNCSIKKCEEIFDRVDYMIADFKTPDEENFKAVTGGDLSTVKENLLYRVKTGKPLLVRVPLIKYFNAGKENAERFAEFFLKLKEEGQNENLYFEILTYHEFGKEKYERLGKTYSVTNGFVTDEDVKILFTELKKNNLNVINT
ncbi:MAG: radical SAM protein, partial [Oscillospiraceae bacterium]|nr:radical SAM protein [Oscillospiraceae bacterium]